MATYAFKRTIPYSIRCLLTTPGLLIATLLSLSIISCSKKYVCGNTTSLTLPSKVLGLSTVGFTDSPLAHLFGYTIGWFEENGIRKTHSLISTDIELTNLETKEKFYVLSDRDGNYEIHPEPGTYSIRHNYTGYNALEIERIKLNAYESKECDIRLGSGVILQTNTN